MKRQQQGTGVGEPPQVTEWPGLYKQSWNNLCVAEAYSHPAKYARALIRTIYQHAREAGWLPQGTVVLDPFAGTALGSWDCMDLGCQFVGIELEQPFCDIGNGCECTGITKEDWVRFYGRWTRLRYAEGRYWCPQCLAQAPQITPARTSTSRTFRTQPAPGRKQRSKVFAYSPIPFPDRRDGVTIPRTGLTASLFGETTATYNRNSGQIPTTRPHHYTGNLEHWARKGKTGATLLRGDSRHLASVLAEAGYTCAISSPPYAGSLHLNESVVADIVRLDRKGVPIRGGATSRHHLPNQHANQGYGTSPDQLGNTTGATFWEAARDVVAGVFQVLKPGGVAIWVVKAYCRDGKIVDFPGDWQKLCEACGFQTLHEHHALLTEDHGVQTDLFAGAVPQQTLRASFFRRLHMKKRPDLAILWETVWCMQKPLSTASLPPNAAWEQMPLVACDCVLSSPPYADGNDKRGLIDWSKTHHGSREKAYGSGRSSDADGCNGYGHSPGQLGALPAGRVEAVLDCVVSSPPYAECIQNGQSGIDKTKGIDPRKPHSLAVRRIEQLAEGYGDSPGQLGAMREGRKP